MRWRLQESRPLCATAIRATNWCCMATLCICIVRLHSCRRVSLFCPSGNFIQNNNNNFGTDFRFKFFLDIFHHFSTETEWSDYSNLISYATFYPTKITRVTKEDNVDWMMILSIADLLPIMSFSSKAVCNASLPYRGSGKSCSDVDSIFTGFYRIDPINLTWSWSFAEIFQLKPMIIGVVLLLFWFDRCLLYNRLNRFHCWRPCLAASFARRNFLVRSDWFEEKGRSCNESIWQNDHDDVSRKS